MEKAFPAAASAVPQSPQGAASREPAPSTDANAYVRLALTAVRTNDYAASVIALDAVQRMPKVSAQQLMAVERAKQAITAELMERASRGDAKARAELAAIEKTLSQ